MAKTNSKAGDMSNERMTVSPEERVLVEMYRELARWDRTFYFLILQALAFGKLTEKTDDYSFDEIVRCSDLPKRREAA